MSTGCLYVAQAAPAPMIQGSRRASYALLMALLSLSLAVSGAPSPLYAGYAARWHLSPLTLTVVFAVHAVAALGAILLAGPLIDAVGRKPALLLATAGMTAGLVVFMTAHGVAALLVARALHGASIGTAVVAGGAALLDLRPDEGARTGRITGTVFSLGMGLGVLASAVLAEFAPDPFVLPYAVVGIVTAAALLGVALMPETHTQRTGRRPSIAKPQVPSTIAADFRFAALGAAASWVMLGLYLSLFPQLAAQQTGIHHLVFSSGVVAAMSLAAAAAQWFARNLPARLTATVGDIGMAVMMLASVPLLFSGHAVAVLLSAVLLGTFFGLTFSGSLRHLNQLIPAAHRGNVMSAFYVLCYSAMAVPTVLAGAAAT